MSIQIQGLKKVQDNINSIPKRTMRGVEKAINLIYDKSQPLVPVDTGRLKRSGEITPIENGYQLKYEAHNPKNDYNYAPIQHENLNYHHTVGQAKYLEKAVIDNMDNIKKLIIDEVLK